ncbi:hypothetical protein ACJX0J_028799, partial [Zea mays]
MVKHLKLPFPHFRDTTIQFMPKKIHDYYFFLFQHAVEDIYNNIMLQSFLVVPEATELSGVESSVTSISSTQPLSLLLINLLLLNRLAGRLHDLLHILLDFEIILFLHDRLFERLLNKHCLNVSFLGFGYGLVVNTEIAVKAYQEKDFHGFFCVL